jgi:hypothetical protein
VANKHYWRVTEADHKKALQQADAPIGTEEQTAQSEASVSAEFASMPYSAKHLMSPAGLEPTTHGLKVRCSTN